MKIWTFTEAAKECGLKTSSGVTRRIQALERGGQGLSVDRGEIAIYGGKRVLTDRGVERLKGFVRGKVGRPRMHAKLKRLDVVVWGHGSEEERESKEGIKGWDL